MALIFLDLYENLTIKHRNKAIDVVLSRFCLIYHGTKVKFILVNTILIHFIDTHVGTVDKSCFFGWEMFLNGDGR